MRRPDRLLEQDREVVDNGVAARKLLHHLRRSAEDQTPQVLGLAVGDQLPEGGHASRVTRDADRVRDYSDLRLDVGVVAARAIKRRQHRGSLLRPVLSEQPPRRFGQPEHQNEDYHGKDTLERDGESPNEGVGAVDATIVYPICDQSSDGNVATLDTDEFPAVV